MEITRSPRGPVSSGMHVSWDVYGSNADSQGPTIRPVKFNGTKAWVYDVDDY